MAGEARALPSARVAAHAMFGGTAGVPIRPHLGAGGILSVSVTPCSHLSHSRSHSRSHFPAPGAPPCVPPSPARCAPSLTLCPSPVCAEELWGEPGELQRGAAEAGAAAPGEGALGGSGLALPPPGPGLLLSLPRVPRSSLGVIPAFRSLRWLGGAGTTLCWPQGPHSLGGPDTPRPALGSLLKQGCRKPSQPLLLLHPVPVCRDTQTPGSISPSRPSGSVAWLPRAAFGRS